MAILKIARMGHPVLAASAKEIADPTKPGVARLVNDMVETLADAGGVGLAAPQVHVSARLVILAISAQRLAAEGEEPQSGISLTAMINPVIEPLSDDKASDWESCLSLPDLAGLVPRFTKIKVTYKDLKGGVQEIQAKDFHARVIQHECDHLDGVLYLQRIEDLSQFGFSEELARARRAEESREAEAERQAAAND